MSRTIIIGNARDSFDETPNFSFPIPRQNVHGGTFIEALSQAVIEIDTALDTVNDSTVASASSIATLQTNVTSLTNTKKNIRPMPTTAAITRDGNGNITYYQTAEETLSNFVYTADVLNSYRSTVNGVTYQVTLTRDGNDDITAISVTTL